MSEHFPVYIGQDAVGELLRFCQARGFERFLLVADRNTERVMGRAVTEALRGAGADVIPVLLDGAEIVADEEYLVQVLLRLDQEPCVFVAVGSGTITDITRFVSHRTRSPFISVPTAASVDGYTSMGAPLVIRNVKVNIKCHSPIAIFADLGVLCAAPTRLTAAGFGDLLGKLVAVADWQLGNVLWDERYDAAIAARSRGAALAAAPLADRLAAGDADAVRLLMDGLAETGFCMLDFGASFPASGAEHHMSHLWELKLLREGRPAIFHGAKVGIASIITAGVYEQVRSMSRAEASARLAQTRLPDRAAEIAAIREGYLAITDEVVASHTPFLEMTEARFDALKARILDRWDEIQAIAAAVPAPATLADWLARAGGVTLGSQVGLGDDEVALATRCAHYLRNQFTVLKLGRMLGL